MLLVFEAFEPKRIDRKTQYTTCTPLSAGERGNTAFVAKQCFEQADRAMKCEGETSERRHHSSSGVLLS